MDIHTNQVTLHPLGYEETERILRRHHDADEPWATGYPSLEQLDFLAAFLVELRTAKAGSHWQSQLRRRSDGLVIGGAGVTGPPDARGSVVIGYEIQPQLLDEVFGVSYGVEIVGALLQVAREMGARRVTTATPRNDEVRSAAYLSCGLVETARSSGGIYFAIDLR